MISEFKRYNVTPEILKTFNPKTDYLKMKLNDLIYIYEAFEDDGYIFLNDLTEERDFSIEDIDFVVDCYQGDGTYQVIDGEYRKIED